MRTRARYLGALGLEDLGIVAPHTPDNTTSLPDLSPRITSITPDNAAASSRSRRRSLMLHRLIVSSIDWPETSSWRPQVVTGIARNEHSIQGTPHRSALERWKSWIESGNIETMPERTALFREMERSLHSCFRTCNFSCRKHTK